MFYKYRKPYCFKWNHQSEPILKMLVNISYHKNKKKTKYIFKEHFREAIIVFKINL